MCVVVVLFVMKCQGRWMDDVETFDLYNSLSTLVPKNPSKHCRFSCPSLPYSHLFSVGFEAGFYTSSHVFAKTKTKTSDFSMTKSELSNLTP